LRTVVLETFEESAILMWSEVTFFLSSEIWLGCDSPKYSEKVWLTCYFKVRVRSNPVSAVFGISGEAGKRKSAGLVA
jgi:hypothetical protein